MDGLAKQNDIMIEKNKNIYKKLAYACNDRVVRTGKEADKNLIVIMKNNEIGVYDYTIIRVSKSSKTAMITKHKESNIKATVLTTIDAVRDSPRTPSVPNAVILWKNIVVHLSGEVIGYRTDDATEKTMINEFKRIGNMKFDVIEESS